MGTVVEFPGYKPAPQVITAEQWHNQLRIDAWRERQQPPAPITMMDRIRLWKVRRWLKREGLA